VESHIQRIMELDEFASLQLDKPLPDVRVCDIYINKYLINKYIYIDQYLLLILSHAPYVELFTKISLLRPDIPLDY